MEALDASRRVIQVSVVTVLGAAAVLAMYISAVVAVVLIETGQPWLTAFAVAYLVAVPAVPTISTYRGRRNAKSRLGLARHTIVALLTVNLLAAPVTIAALAM